MPPLAGPGLHPRVCAAGAAASAAIHVVMAGQHAGLMAAGMLLMALVCLPCVLPLWRSGSVGAARMMMGGALGMVAIHAVLLLAPAGGAPGGAAGAAGHRHGGLVVAAAPAAGADAAVSMLALIGWELAAAMLAATWVRRRTLLGATL